MMTKINERQARPVSRTRTVTRPAYIAKVMMNAQARAVREAVTMKTTKSASTVSVMTNITTEPAREAEATTKKITEEARKAEVITKRMTEVAIEAEAAARAQAEAEVLVGVLATVVAEARVLMAAVANSTMTMIFLVAMTVIKVDNFDSSTSVYLTGFDASVTVWLILERISIGYSLQLTVFAYTIRRRKIGLRVGGHRSPMVPFQVE